MVIFVLLIPLNITTIINKSKSRAEPPQWSGSQPRGRKPLGLPVLLQAAPSRGAAALTGPSSSPAQPFCREKCGRTVSELFILACAGMSLRATVLMSRDHPLQRQKRLPRFEISAQYKQKNLLNTLCSFRKIASLVETHSSSPHNGMSQVCLFFFAAVGCSCERGVDMCHSPMIPLTV